MSFFFKVSEISLRLFSFSTSKHINIIAGLSLIFILSKIFMKARQFKNKHGSPAKFCIVIPSYNHSDTLIPLLSALPEIDTIVVDDGSVPKITLPELPGKNVSLIRIENNSGKAAALKEGFSAARSRGYTHAITMDADGQHAPEAIPDFIRAATESPECIITGVRDFSNPAVPPARRTMNSFSNFWLAVETGVRIGDTQCGYRCYPLHALEKVKVARKGFLFEAELLVKASWAGMGIREVKIPTIYTQSSLSRSHYRPLADTFKFAVMNLRLSAAALLLGKETRRKIALKSASKES